MQKAMQCHLPATFWLCLLCMVPKPKWKTKKENTNGTKVYSVLLGKRHHISSKEFESINWLPVNKRVHQCINAITFKFVNNACPHYLNEVYEYTPQCRIESRSNFAKLKVSFWKTNIGQNGLSYIGPSLWNNLSGSLNNLAIYLDLWKKPRFWILLSITWKRNILTI